jgi:hypothetical protein
MIYLVYSLSQDNVVPANKPNHFYYTITLCKNRNKRGYLEPEGFTHCDEYGRAPWLPEKDFRVSPTDQDTIDSWLGETVMEGEHLLFVVKRDSSCQEALEEIVNKLPVKE